MELYLEVVSIADSDGLVPGAGCYETAIRRELTRSYHTFMTVQRANLCRHVNRHASRRAI